MIEHAKTLRLGVHLAKAGRYDEAAEKFLQAIDEAPEDPRGWYGLGLCCARSGRLEDAREALTEAAQLGHPRAQEALDRLPSPDQAQEPAPAEPPAEPTGEQQAPGQVAYPPGAKRSPDAAPGRPKIDLGKPLRVMLVEDKAHERKAISEALYDSLARVSIVESPFAESASRTIVGMGIFDIAIIDWNTSPKDARELLEFLKMTQPHIPVIVLTATWDEQMAWEATRAGADYCLVKASGYARILPYVIEQRFKQSYALQEKIETELGDLYQHARRTYFDAIEYPILLVNKNARVVDANRAVAQLLDTTRERLIAESCDRLFHHTQDQDSFLPLVEVFAAGRQVTVERYEPELKRHFRITTAPIREEDRTEYLNILEDVTEQKKEHSDAAQFLARAVEQLEKPVFCKDSEGRFVFANASFARTLGCRPPELVGRKEDEVTSSPKAQEREAQEREAMSAGQTVTAVQQEGARWLACEVSPVMDESWRALGVLGMIEDVTDARCAPTAASTGDFLRLADLASQAAFELDEKGRVTYASLAAARLLGRGRDELEGTQMEQLLENGSHSAWREARSRVMERGESVSNLDVSLCGRDDGAVPGQLHLMPILAQDNGTVSGIAALFVDTSERKRIRKALGILSGEMPLS